MKMIKYNGHLVEFSDIYEATQFHNLFADAPGNVPLEFDSVESYTAFTEKLADFSDKLEKIDSSIPRIVSFWDICISASHQQKYDRYSKQRCTIFDKVNEGMTCYFTVLVKTDGSVIATPSFYQWIADNITIEIV